MFVKPAIGLQIIDPHRKDRLKQNEWRWVGTDMRSYWARLARDGDVIMSQTKPALGNGETIEGEETVRSSSRKD
jgi:hypothetical protein